ncbi:MAG: hypothetical protein QOG42_831 [Solirubrobacteraceae bacterium]|nr:hypothetical protein [Solirubrobacteraceae bacterium]
MRLPARSLPGVLRRLGRPIRPLGAFVQRRGRRLGAFVQRRGRPLGAFVSRRLPRPSATVVQPRSGRPLGAVALVLAAGLVMGADAPSPPAAARLSTLFSPAPADAPRFVSVSLAVADGARRPHRAGPEYYRQTARERVAPQVAHAFLALYREAERTYGVAWRLIASIHRQETAFSAAPTTYHGLNAFGCCAGPMQFNVSNGPVSTWKRYRDAFRAGNRPKRYPHRTDHHPSIYDDFDAIMGAASLLSDSGAGLSLDSAAWAAAYGYYGHDLFGVTYANQVLARATAWESDGFCPNCGLDGSLVEEFEIAYGAAERKALLAAERKHKKHKKKHEKKHRREAGRTGSPADRADDSTDEAARSRAGDGRPPAPAGGAPASPTPAATAQQPATTTPAPPAAPSGPPPPPAECSPVHRLLGC